MSAFPARATMASPATPDNATAQGWFASLYDAITGLLGLGGTAAEARSVLGVDGPTVVPSVAASALTVALKTASGNDPSATVPLPIPFRSATLSSGTTNVRQAVAATSLVVPSGATLGGANGADQWLYVYALDNAGTVELAISGTHFGPTFISTTTAISATANSATGLYSTTARTNVAMRLIATMRANEVTAGTWATAPAEVTYPDHAANLDTRIQEQAATAFTTGGTTNAYTLSPTPAITVLKAGMEFEVTFHTSPGAGPTLNVSGTGGKSLVYRDYAGVTQFVTAGLVPTGWTSKVHYTGTEWCVMNIATNAITDSAGNVLVGTTFTNGSVSNNKAVVAGVFTTENGITVGVLHNTATTVKTLPNIPAATYLISAWVLAADAPNYGAVSVVVTHEASFNISALRTAALLSISMSGLNVQVTQNSGQSQPVRWSITRIS